MGNNNNYRKYILLFVLIISSIIGAFVLGSVDKGGKIIALLSIDEKDNTNYSVTYKENDFYKDGNIKNQSYVREFVKNINIDYDMLINLSDKATGVYTYNVIAEILVYEPGNAQNDYWRRPETLLPSTTIKFEDAKTVEVAPSVTVDFEKFYQYYLEYKQSNIVTNEADLILKFNLKYNGESSDFEDFSYTRQNIITIPLSEPAFKIGMETSITPENELLTKMQKDKFKMIAKIMSLCLWGFVVVLLFVFIFIYNKDRKSATPYYRKLKKILSTYDSIIVNVDKLTSLEEVSIARVPTFEELLDAQQEVRLPINFKEDKKNKVAKFILLRNNFAWVYILRAGDVNED